jgi:N-acetylglutamate synthase-like GNAT family acetyltransferase
VLPDYQGLGIGRKLVAFVESQARRRGLDEVRLWTREEMSDNIHYYQHLGYHLTHTSIVDDCGRAYFRKQLDHVENAPGNAVVEASR